ncbi:hypothetical protein [Thermoactinomyces sp. CICC 10521]|uniref:hypothetical protein n=1 Tax=Thermoactinomyces sp. CICC 10521 TaxID=2767426 RepID=UPI0018DBDC6A|nr:hypothetical protein [Thermoactinomyces sp. CICC 10521]MBH8608235.1 hypothetical protein [Thermoactinomyces sp. CICC 10521]
MKLTSEEIKLLVKICEKHNITKEHILDLINIEENYLYREKLRRTGLTDKLKNKLDEWSQKGEIV